MSWEFCDCCGCSPCDCDWGLYDDDEKEEKKEKKKESKEKKQ